MPPAEAETEEEEQPEEPEPDEQNGGQDVPEIDEDEQADFDLDVDPEEIEESAGADPVDEQDEDAEEDADDSAEQEAATPAAGTGDTWGDMYCEGLATVATIAKQEAGDGGEVSAERARELHLDQYFNEWVRSRGATEDMPPEQALVVGTSMFLVGTLLTDSELIENALSEVTE